MIGESQITDTPGFPFFEQEIQNPVVHVTGIELLHTVSHPYTVQQHVVYIIHLQFFHRVTVHDQRSFTAPRGRSEIGKFRGNEITLARMAAQSNSHGSLRTPFAISGGGIEVIQPVSQRIVHLAVHHFLVYLVSALFSFLFNRREAHAPVTQNRNFVSGRRIRTISHFVRRYFSRQAAGSCFPFRTATVKRRRRDCRTSSQKLQKLTSVHIFFSLFHVAAL